MGLSSNSIIHLTKKLAALKGILSDDFMIRYCQETIENARGNIDLLVPVVSFCDIPFSQILSHIESYGSYGIGLKKEWAIRNKLNPVLYLEKNSKVNLNLSIANPSFVINTMNNLPERRSLEERIVLDFVRYLKNYEGDLRRYGKKTIKNYRFSDEREWRYTIDPEEDHSIFMNVEDFDESQIKKEKLKLNKKIKNYRLQFKPDDISYIIIKKESERDRIISTIESVKGKYSMNEVKRLTSRIISSEQLKTDF